MNVVQLSACKCIEVDAKLLYVTSHLERGDDRRNRSNYCNMYVYSTLHRKHDVMSYTYTTMVHDKSYLPFFVE